MYKVGYQDVFLDVDPEQGITVGDKWELVLYENLRRANALIFLSAPVSNNSKWCFAELVLARSAGKPVFPIIVEDDKSAWLADTQGVRLAHGLSEVVARLVEALRRNGLTPHYSIAWDSTRPPYPGLMPFSELDAAVFFGRYDETERLIGYLQANLDPIRCVAIIGPSGSGKSSLLRAGLIPRLAKEPDRWELLPIFTPGQRPLEALASSLSQAFRTHGLQRSSKELLQALSKGTGGLAAMLEEVCSLGPKSPSRILMAVDQGEELVTRSGAPERDTFFRLIREALRVERLRVVSTIRSEFLHATPQEGDLAALVDVALLLGPLNRERLPEAIEGPARRADISFDSGLISRMVDDTVGGDALPLLAYVLNQLVERAGPTRRITNLEYEKMGGVVGALQVQAEMVANSLMNSGHEHQMLSTLLKLVTIHTDSEPTGRRLRRSTLTSLENDIIQAFVDARLLIATDIEGEASVGLAHEALLRRWPRLSEAIELHQAALRNRSELERLAEDWDQAGRRVSYLVGGDRLATGRQWTQTHPDEADGLPLVRAFLDRSAEYNATVMLRASETLANQALLLLRDDPELSALLALAAIEEYRSSPQATLVLSEALAVSYVNETAAVLILRDEEEDRSISEVAWSPDGSQIMTMASHLVDRVCLWNAHTGDRIRTMTGRRAIAWSPDGTRIATANENDVGIWDASPGTKLFDLIGHSDIIHEISWSPDGTRMATSAFDGTIGIWDARSGIRLQTFGEEGFVPDVSFKISSVSWAPTGALLATNTHSGVYIWDINTGKAISHDDLGSSLLSVAWSPDGQRILTCDWDVIRVWQFDSGAELLALRAPHENTVHAAWSPDGSRIASMTELGGLRIWDVASGECLLALRVADESSTSIDWSPDGTCVVTPSWENTVQIWRPHDIVERLVSTAREGLQRGLSLEERQRFRLA